MIVPAMLAGAVMHWTWSKRHVPRLVGGNGYHTHIPALAAATTLGNTRLPILELGAGEGSTAMLNMIAHAQGRPLVTVETNPAWVQPYLQMASPLHRFVMVRDWAHAPIEAMRWGVIFVDHGDPPRRGRDVRRALDHADIVVMHDSEDPQHGYEGALAGVPYRYDFRAIRPYTTIASRTTPLPTFAL